MNRLGQLIVCLLVLVSVIVLYSFSQTFEENLKNEVPESVAMDEDWGEPSDPPTQAQRPLGDWIKLTAQDLTEVQTGSDAGGCSYDKKEKVSDHIQEDKVQQIVGELLKMPVWKMNLDGFPSTCLSLPVVEDFGNYYRFDEALLILPFSSGYPESLDAEYFMGTFLAKSQGQPQKFCFETKVYRQIISQVLAGLKLVNDCEF